MNIEFNRKKNIFSWHTIKANYCYLISSYFSYLKHQLSLKHHLKGNL